MKRPALVYKTYIRTTAKKLWLALTKPEFTRLYWAGVENISDWEEGSKWEHIGGEKEREVWITGRVLQSVPPSRLVLSWADPDNLADQSRVTFEIEAMKGMVCLTVTHDRFKSGSTMAGKVSRGWPRVLSSLKSYLETGKGLNVFA